MPFHPLCPEIACHARCAGTGQTRPHPVSFGTSHDASVIHHGFMTRSSSLSRGTPSARIAVLAVLLQLAFAGHCVGDQHQWNPFLVCREAAETIAARPLLVSYCSLADEDYVEFLAARSQRIVATPSPELYELIVSGERLYRSDCAFSSGEFPVSKEQWTFHEETEGAHWFSLGVDLAYVYVQVAGGTFRCLAQLLDLPCVVAVETIRLPDHVLDEVVARHGIKCLLTAWPLSPFGRCPCSGR